MVDESIEKLPEGDAALSPEKGREKLLEHSFGFFNLSESQKEKLKSEIEQAGGEIEVVVHPFFTSHENREAESPRLKDYRKDFPDRNNAIEEMHNHLAERLKEGKPGTPPLFLFEEKPFLPDAEKMLADKVGEEMRGDLYVVSTRHESGKPELPKGVVNDDFYFNDPWNSTADMLNKIGVKKITIGGAYFDNRYANAPFDGCAGEVIKGFAPHFDVTVSEFAYPQRGSDMIGGAEIKKGAKLR